MASRRFRANGILFGWYISNLTGKCTPNLTPLSPLKPITARQPLTTDEVPYIWMNQKTTTSPFAVKGLNFYEPNIFII